MEAASNGHADVTEVLLKHGADVNAKGDFGYTALMEAARGSLIIAASGYYAKTAEILLKHGADVNAKSDAGLTALMEAASKG